MRAGIAPGSGSLGSQAGDININATGEITLADGFSFIANGVGRAGQGAVGNGGSININTKSLSL